MHNSETLRVKYATEDVADDRDRVVRTDLAPLKDGVGYPTSICTQVLTILKRNRYQLLRDPALAKLRVGASCGVGLALGIL